MGRRFCDEHGKSYPILSGGAGVRYFNLAGSVRWRTAATPSAGCLPCGRASEYYRRRRQVDGANLLLGDIARNLAFNHELRHNTKSLPSSQPDCLGCRFLGFWSAIRNKSRARLLEVITFWVLSASLAARMGVGRISTGKSPGRK